MPLKWKIYYWCSMYVLLWCVILIGMLVYLVFADWPGVREILPRSIAAIVCFMLSFKAVLSIRGIGYYKSSTLYPKGERLAFIVGGCIFAILGLACLTFGIIDFSSTDFKGSSVLGKYSITVVFYFSFLATALCCIFIAALDLFLLKAIRNKHNASIDNIGQHIAP